jgi:hypothetical protein
LENVEVGTIDWTAGINSDCELIPGSYETSLVGACFITARPWVSIVETF